MFILLSSLDLIGNYNVCNTLYFYAESFRPIATSALEIFRRMRYIYLHFTYLLTYEFRVICPFLV